MKKGSMYLTRMDKGKYCGMFFLQNKPSRGSKVICEVFPTGFGHSWKDASGLEIFEIMVKVRAGRYASLDTC